jgi:hypothetical protein
MNSHALIGRGKVACSPDSTTLHVKCERAITTTGCVAQVTWQMNLVLY